MRPQQRKFEVEVKPSRRRTTTRPSSIWGDTDLRALAREAEADAPHLFDPTAQEVAPVRGQAWKLVQVMTTGLTLPRSPIPRAREKATFLTRLLSVLPLSHRLKQTTQRRSYQRSRSARARRAEVVTLCPGRLGPVLLPK